MNLITAGYKDRFFLVVKASIRAWDGWCSKDNKDECSLISWQKELSKGTFREGEPCLIYEKVFWMPFLLVRTARVKPIGEK